MSDLLDAQKIKNKLNISIKHDMYDSYINQNVHIIYTYMYLYKRTYI